MPTWRATLLLLATAPLFALAGWQPLIGWLGAGLLLLIVGLMLIDRQRAGGADRFEVVREHESKLSLGADNPIRVSVRHRLVWPVRFWLRDEPPDAWVAANVVLDGTAQPRRVWRGRYSVHPLRRGDYSFGNATLRWQGPLGLMLRQATVVAPAPVKVYPNLLDVRKYDLLLRRNRLQQIGLRQSRQFGRGTEYERLRDYQPDDDFRRINWKATARRHKPITVEYQVERSQNIMALLDIGRMMQSPVAQIAKLDYAVNAVLLLSYVAGGMGDKVGMLAFADEVDHYLGPRQGREQFHRMLELLYGVEAQPTEPDYALAFNQLDVKLRRRALVILFTDLSSGMSLDVLVAHVSRLARRSLPLVVTISDPDIVAASQTPPNDSLSVYQQSAAARLLEERTLVLETLHRHGVLTLDVPANQLSLAVIQRYLDIKRRAQL